MWSRPVVLYDGFADNDPKTPAFDDEDLVAMLTTHADPQCDVTTCAGRSCAAKKLALSWSPASYVEGTTRDNDNVTSINYAVFDLDHVPAGALAELEASIGEYEHVVHSTHGHDLGDPTADPPRAADECYRLIFPLSRPVLPGEWAAVYDVVVAALGLPAVDRRVDLARLYACPTARVGVAPFAAHRRGAPLDVDDALRAAGVKPAKRDLVERVASPAEPVSLSAMRSRLSDARRAKAQGDDRARTQAAIIGRILDGSPLARVGERDDTILRACGLLAYWLPAGSPWEVAAELLRPSVVAMLEVDPDERGVDYMLEVARLKYERQAESRAAADAVAEASRQRTKAALDKVANRPLREVAEELDETPGADWTDLLIEVGKAGPKVCEHNAQVILSCAPDLRGTVTWNDLAKRVEFRGGPLAGVSPNSVDVAAAAYLQKTYSFYGNAALVGRALLQVARENPRDPIQEYLGELAWDGEARLDTFLEVYMGVDVSTPELLEYVRGVSRKWLISLVARALRPGCKVDTVLILEGDQGAGKSSGLEALVGSEWFLDTALEIGDKDTMQAIASAWLVELGELASLRRAETNRTRQFVTSKVDKFRAPYGKVTEESPRRCILVGTTNPEGSGYLTDRTGNRRYWPVTVGLILVDLITRDRDQLLAEAVAAFRAGEKWWFKREEATMVAAQTEQRLTESTYEEAIERWWYGESPARRPPRFTLTDVAEMALKLSVDRVDHRTRVEIGHALRRLGFPRRGERRTYEASPEMLDAPQRVSAARASQQATLSALQGGRQANK